MARKQTGSAIWTCDRCAGKTESGCTSMVPQGWTVLSGLGLGQRDLCDACTRALVVFMGGTDET